MALFRHGARGSEPVRIGSTRGHIGSGDHDAKSLQVSTQADVSEAGTLTAPSRKPRWQGKDREARLTTSASTGSCEHKAAVRPPMCAGKCGWNDTAPERQPVSWIAQGGMRLHMPVRCNSLSTALPSTSPRPPGTAVPLSFPRTGAAQGGHRGRRGRQDRHGFPVPRCARHPER